MQAYVYIYIATCQGSGVSSGNHLPSHQPRQTNPKISQQRLSVSSKVLFAEDNTFLAYDNIHRNVNFVQFVISRLIWQWLLSQVLPNGVLMWFIPNREKTPRESNVSYAILYFLLCWHRVTPEDLDGGIIPLRYVKYQNVQSLLVSICLVY